MSVTQTANIHNTTLDKACEHLSNGYCVAIPTETVYGLAADASNGNAVARIFEMKGRPRFNPLICHVDGIEMAQSYATFDPISQKLAERFWPGPLTLVVPLLKQTHLHPLVSAGLDTVGLRHPQGISSQLISQFGRPLAAPSANRSGKISPTTADHVRGEFSGTDLLIVDNGPCEVGLESTIVKVDEGVITLLRPGGVTTEMIEETTGIAPMLAKGGKIEAPGMMVSHYAPNATVTLNSETCPSDAAWLQFGAVSTKHSGPSLNLSPRKDLIEAAANLYDYLKQLDGSGSERIYVYPIPMQGLGLAINDRLQRAAAPRPKS